MTKSTSITATTNTDFKAFVQTFKSQENFEIIIPTRKKNYYSLSFKKEGEDYTFSHYYVSHSTTKNIVH